MLSHFSAFIKHYHLHDKTCIVACSGGMDSVVLAHLCYQSGIRFCLAHCNFGLRGDESDGDESFVKDLAARFHVPFYVQRFDTKRHRVLKKLSVQEAARELRYNWFETLRIETGAAYVLLAHHADDNVETVLMNLFRGTGLHGLTGMPEQKENAHALRPLLKVSRKEIEAYAQAHRISWREDSSNASDTYTRNFFRHHVIPLVQKQYPNASANVLSTIERLKKTEALYETMLHGVLKKLWVEEKGNWKIPFRKLLLYQHTSLPYELFKKFYFSEAQMDEIVKLAQSTSGSFVQNDWYRVLKHRNWLVVSKRGEKDNAFYSIEEGEKDVLFSDKKLKITTLSKAPFAINKSSQVAQLDARAVRFPLVLRRWKAGDYFYPLGMRKKKKLARFFIDQKLSLIEKENVYVLETAGRIAWVVGYRIDDRFKITDGTREIVLLTIE